MIHTEVKALWSATARSSLLFFFWAKKKKAASSRSTPKVRTSSLLRPGRRHDLPVGRQRSGAHLQHAQEPLRVGVVEFADRFHRGVALRVHLVRHVRR